MAAACDSAGDSLDYRVISEWIAAGAPEPKASDPEIKGLVLYPAAVRLKPGETQQVLVQALYSDGRIEDVTHWAKYSGTDDSVALVDDTGRVKVTGHGEAYVSVWFASQIGRVTMTSPYDTSLDPKVFASAERHNSIDEKNLAKLASLRIPPSPGASDAVFLRRAYLDATGTLPTLGQVEAFLSDPHHDKRARLVDRLLESAQFVDYWSYKWSDLLLVSSQKLPAPAMWAFYRFVRDNVGRNVAWDRFARSVITAQGSTLSNGGANFFVLHRDPIDLAENASMAFMGLALTCCALPQPSTGKMDAGPVLRVCQSVWPREAEGWRNDRRRRRDGSRRRGDRASAAWGRNASATPRWRGDGTLRPPLASRGAGRLARAAG